MTKIFKPPVYIKTVLISFVAIFGAAPLVVFIPAMEIEPDILLPVFGITYLCVSPVLILFLVILIKTGKQMIGVGPEKIMYKSAKYQWLVNWRDIEYFYCDYISVRGRYGDMYYQLYEVGNSSLSFRFNYRFGYNEADPAINFIPVKVFSKKAFSFDAYGLNVNYADRAELVSLIKEYTGIEIERKEGLF